jgi:hypothetical protein
MKVYKERRGLTPFGLISTLVGSGQLYTPAVFVPEKKSPVPMAGP